MATFKQYMKKQDKGKKEPQKVGLVPRGLNEFNKALVSLPDTLINSFPDFTSPHAVQPKNRLENILRSIGSIRDITPPETSGEKRVESYGKTAGSLIPFVATGGAGTLGRAGIAGKGLAQTLFGATKPIKSLTELGTRTTAGTLGSAVAGAETEPKIKEVFPESPAAQFIGSLLAGTAGGIGGSQLARTVIPKIPKNIPLRTASQRATENTPEQRKLIGREKALAESPKSAEQLNKVYEGQDASLYSQIRQTIGNINPRKVSADLKQYIKSKVVERAETYKKSLGKVESKWNKQKKSNPDASINVDNALKLTDNLIEEAANGSSLQKALMHVRNLIQNNTKSFSKLKNAVTELNNTGPEGKFTKDFSLAKQDETLIKNIKNVLMEDIDKAVPGYGELSKKYAQDSAVLSDLLKGSVGKVGKSAEKAPSSIYDKIFEKTDPLEISQIKEALGADKFKEATKGYLGQLLKKGEGETPSKTIKNVFDRLSKKKNILDETLPDDMKSKINKLQEEYQSLTQNRPQEGFLQEAYNIAEKPSNYKALSPHAGSVIAKKILNPITRDLKLNEALTGVLPTAQIAEEATSLGAKSLPRISSAIPASEPSLPMEGVQVQDNITPEIEQETAVTPKTAQRKPRSFNEWMESTEEKEPQKSAPKGFDAWLQKQEGMNKENESTIEKKKRPSLEEIVKRLNIRPVSLEDSIRMRESGGNPKAKNKLGYLGQYQFGAKALEDVGFIKPGASKGRNAEVLSNPKNWVLEGGEEAFLNNPELQKQAMSKLMALNRSRLESAGLLKPSTSPQELNAMLSAAHLGGVGGVKALTRGEDRHDAFGTPVSEYYRRGYRI